jgi:uncharacterized protein
MQSLSSQPGDWWERFEALLDDQNDWPEVYTFKFIVPADGLSQIRAVFAGQPLKVRESRKGNYLSVTARIQMTSAQEVIDVYKRASLVEGVISL